MKKAVCLFFLALTAASPAFARPLSARIEKIESTLADMQAKLADAHTSGADELILQLQDMQTRFEALTADTEIIRHDLSALKEEIKRVNDDNALHFKDLEDKQTKTLERVAALENVINKAREEQEKAEKQRALEAKKEQEKKAAAQLAEKKRKEKVKTTFGAKKPKALYDEALDALNKKDYKKAQERLAAFLELHPNNALAGNAQYWLGEAYYAQGNYDKAAVAFADGLKNNPASAKAPDLLFKLGMTLSRLKKKQDACVAFDTFKNQYPKVSEAMKKQLAAETKKLSCGK